MKKVALDIETAGIPFLVGEGPSPLFEHNMEDGKPVLCTAHEAVCPVCELFVGPVRRNIRKNLGLLFPHLHSSRAYVDNMPRVLRELHRDFDELKRLTREVQR